MRRIVGLFCAVIAGALVAGTPLAARAQSDILYEPAAPDFGAVLVGEAASMVVVARNNNGNILVRSIALSGDPAFSVIATRPAPPVGVVPGGGIEIELGFAPTAAGTVSAVLEVETGTGFYAVTILGTGSVPGDPVDAILAFFDAAVDNGELFGSGPGASAAGRLGALRGMIEDAGAALEAGELDAACDALWSALRRVDGSARPPDFAEGPAAAGLAAELEDLLDELGCR